MVAAIPGISRELAHRILMHFKTPRKFFKASPAELRRVEGLGEARIAKILEALDTVYPPVYMSEGNPSADGS
jgi:ERCC4-type nuclease